MQARTDVKVILANRSATFLGTVLKMCCFGVSLETQKHRLNTETQNHAVEVTNPLTAVQRFNDPGCHPRNEGGGGTSHKKKHESKSVVLLDILNVIMGKNRTPPVDTMVTKVHVQFSLYKTTWSGGVHSTKPSGTDCWHWVSRGALHLGAPIAFFIILGGKWLAKEENVTEWGGGVLSGVLGL